MASHLIRIPRLYRRIAPFYAPLRPFWTRTACREAERYFESVALPGALTPHSEVLDLGCGSGANLKRLRSLNLPFAHYTGADLTSAMLAKRKGRSPAASSFILSDVYRLPLQANSFDVILSTWMFSHLIHPSQVVSEARRLLRPGGWLIIACFIRPGWLSDVLFRPGKRWFLMHDISLNDIRNWPGLVDVKTFAWGCNAVVRLRNNEVPA